MTNLNGQEIDRYGRLVTTSAKDQKKNQNPQLKNLSDIRWFGNVAVGKDTRIGFSEWWAICLPTGALISYVGKEAEARAIAKAKELQEYY